MEPFASILTAALIKNEPMSDDEIFEKAPKYTPESESNTEIPIKKENTEPENTVTVKLENVEEPEDYSTETIFITKYKKSYPNTKIISRVGPPSALKSIVKVNNKLRFVCAICKTDFASGINLDRHKIYVHRPWAMKIEGYVYCIECEKWFMTIHKFDCHPCHFAQIKRCSFCFVKDPVKQHFMLHGFVFRGKTYHCILCDSCITDTSNYEDELLNTHMQYYHKLQGVYHCLKCNTRFSSTQSLSLHLINAHNGCTCVSEYDCTCNFFSLEAFKESQKRKQVENCGLIDLPVCGVLKKQVDVEYPLSLNKSKNTTYSRPKNNIKQLFSENKQETASSSMTNITNINQNETITETAESTQILQTNKCHSQPINAESIDLPYHPTPLPTILPTQDETNGNISYNTKQQDMVNSDVACASGLRIFPETGAKQDVIKPILIKRKYFKEPKICICDICDMDFIAMDELRMHRKLIHRPWALEVLNEVYCPECKQWFDDEFKFKGHSPCLIFAVKKRCPVCFMDQPIIDHFDLHNISIHRVNYYVCTLCESNTEYKIKDLNVHMQKVHNREGVYECLSCKIYFSKVSFLKKHLIEHRSEGTNNTLNAINYKLKKDAGPVEHIQCNVCDKIFEPRNFAKHKRTHEGCLCFVCGKSFKSYNHLKEHQNKHTKIRSFDCTECGRKFTFRKYLRQHLKIHKVKKNFNCEFCNQSFTQQTSLIYHMASHTKEDIFKCTICDIKFDLQSKVTAHMKMHTANGTNPHICKICNKDFAHHCNLIVHMRIHAALLKENDDEEMDLPLSVLQLKYKECESNSDESDEDVEIELNRDEEKKDSDTDSEMEDENKMELSEKENEDENK